MRLAASTLAELRDSLAALDADRLVSRGAMPPAAALGHCAQSIEYSLAGYPRLKPWPVRRLIGPRLLAGFRRDGRMRHDLAAPAALRRLLAAIDAFAAHAGPWPEHLAFGRMDRAAYSDAHRLHILNHFEALDLAA